MAITYYMSNKILDNNFGRTSYTVPTTLYFGLSTTPINNDGTGATEPSSSYAYARIPVTNDKTNFGSASNGSLVNLTNIQFAESTGSWGTITHVFLADALTSGNILYFDALSVSRQVQSSTTVLFAPSAVTVQMTNS